MEYNTITKYTIIEAYPSIIETKIPLFDILIGIGYYFWIFIYFIISFFKNLIKGPKYLKTYIYSFFKKEEFFEGFPKEKDFNIDASTLNEEVNIDLIKNKTELTDVKIYRGKKAFKKLKNVIQENNLYEFIDYLPIRYFTLREEKLIGNFKNNNTILTKGYSIPVYNYIVFIEKIKSKIKLNKK